MARNSNSMNSNFHVVLCSQPSCRRWLAGASRRSPSRKTEMREQRNAEHPLVPALRHARTCVENVQKN